MGKGLRDSPRDALLSESVPPQELGKPFISAPWTRWAVFGPHSGDHFIPLVSAITPQCLSSPVISIFAVYVLYLWAVRPSRIKPKTPVLFSFSKIYRKFKPLLIAVFILARGSCLCRSAILKACHRPFRQGHSLMYLVYTVSFTVFAIPFGRLSDRIGRGSDRGRLRAPSFLRHIGGHRPQMLPRARGFWPLFRHDRRSGARPHRQLVAPQPRPARLSSIGDRFIVFGGIIGGSI